MSFSRKIRSWHSSCSWKKIDRRQSLSESAEAASSLSEGTDSRAGLRPTRQAGAHSLAWATLRCEDTVGIMPYRFTMLDETVETRRPWRGSPWAPIRGSSFLCIVCIIRQYLSSFAIRSRKRACTSRSHGMRPLTLWQKKKKLWWQRTAAMLQSTQSIIFL